MGASRGMIVVLAAVAASGCAGAKLYIVDMDLQSRRVLQTANAEPAPEARAIVKLATSLAFNPPDVCTDVKAAGAGATEVSNVMRLQCGVLMTELEAAATRAGFSVLSWQTLRSGRAIDYARTNNVDIIFEVNDLSFDIPVQDLYSVTNMSFRERPVSGGPVKPLVVADTMATAKRCQEQYWKTAQPTQTVTLDVKMVSVADGRVRWTYRDTRTDDTGEKLQVTRSWVAGPEQRLSSLAGLGAGAIGGGAVLALLPLLIAPETQSERATANTLQAVGGVAIGVGVASLIVAFILPRDYPSPDSILCYGPSIEDQALPQAQVVSTPGASISFNEQRSLKSGGGEERRRKLLSGVIQQFIDTVSAMKK